MINSSKMEMRIWLVLILFFIGTTIGFILFGSDLNHSGWFGFERWFLVVSAIFSVYVGIVVFKVLKGFLFPNKTTFK